MDLYHSPHAGAASQLQQWGGVGADPPDPGTVRRDRAALPPGRLSERLVQPLSLQATGKGLKLLAAWSRDSPRFRSACV
jgi:hypothetical protein